jgi:hypothetical protein
MKLFVFTPAHVALGLLWLFGLHPHPVRAASPLVLSEFFAASDGLVRDEDDDKTDWIEVHNPGTAPVNLEGWSLTDDITKPLKWRFPATNIAGKAFVLVYASGKDRAFPGEPLHTNFKLSNAGQYLALIEPDGTTIATAFSPSYPQQIDGVSYGLPQQSSSRLLLDTGTVGRFRVPSDANLGDSWRQVDFNDASWTRVTNAVGFEATAGASFTPVFLASSVDQFSGTQGQNGWSYGYWNKKADSDGIYTATKDFVPFPRSTGAFGPANYWTGTLWDWPSGNPPWIELSASGGHPSGDANNVHWVIRRYVSPTNGTLRITGTIAHSGTCGDGVIVRILVSGQAAWSQSLQGTSSGYTTLVTVTNGAPIDFAIDPGSANSDGCDGTTFTAKLYRVSNDTTVIADSQADWSTGGVQGERGWSYGYYLPGSDTVAGYQSADFIPFPRSNAAWGAANFWTGDAWDWPNGDPPWDVIFRDVWHPNGVNSGAEHWIVRRWLAPISGTLQVDWHVAKQNLNGTGVTGKVFVNGSQRDTVSIAGNDFAGVSRTLAITVTAGQTVDFVLTPLGAGGQTDDGADGSFFNATLTASTSLTGEFVSDVGAALRNRNASCYLRFPFTLANAADLSTLALQVNYDDGFVAYLNGQPIGSRNEPESLDWNSAATVSRDDGSVRRTELLDLTPYLGLLRTGNNVLAIQGLNASASDADFLLRLVLSGQTTGLGGADGRYFVTPTPAAANGSGTLNVGPRIEDVSHTPLIPREDEPLVVTARILRTVDPVGSVRLYYRVMYRTETNVVMLDDGLHGDGVAGDGLYGATIPASAFGTAEMIRYFITATDTGGDASREPPFEDPINSPQYRGTVAQDPRFTTRLPVLQWFVADANAPTTPTGTRCSVFFAGQFLDNIGVNLHGQSSSGFPKKSFDFDLNPGHSLEWTNTAPKVDDFNLLTTYPDKAHLRNIIAYETFRDAGSPYHFAFPVRVQLNGAFWGDAHFVENGDENYLKRLGMDVRGALYKMYNSLETATGEKKTRKEEGTADLQALIDGCKLTGTARAQYLFDNVNVPEVINYLAAMILIGNTDCCHKNYYLYRDTEITGEWQMLPWDVDLSFGRVWSCNSPCLTYWDDQMHPDTPLFIGNGNTLGTAIFGTPEIRQMYVRRLRTLAEELLQPLSTPLAQRRYETRIDDLAALISPEAALDLTKWGTWGDGSASSACCVQNLSTAVQLIKTGYLDPRRRHLLQTLTTANGGEIPATQTPGAAPNFGTLDFNPSSGRQSQEYIELKNPLNEAMDISGWRMAGAIRHEFPGGTVIPAGRSLYLTPDARAFRARTVTPRGGQGLLVQGNYEGQLSARGETLELWNRSGQLVKTNRYLGNPSEAQKYLRITEIMYHPAPPPSGKTPADDFEYIELKNTGTAPLDLTGIHFTNGLRFSFSGSAVTQLGAGQRVLVVKSLAAFTSRYGTGLPIAGAYLGNLNNNGERLSLHDRVGEGILDFEYKDGWEPITDGLGFSLVAVDEAADYRAWDLSTQWRASGRVSGSPGVDDPSPLQIPAVLLNEALTHTDPPDLDSIEIHNPLTGSVDVGGWYLSDDFFEPRKYRLPPSTVLAAGGYRVFDETDFNPTPATSSNFSLSSTGDEVWLFSADVSGNLTGYYHGFDYGAAQNGVSFGRHVTSAGDEHFVAQRSRTLGALNSGPAVGPVVISEIMYHPADAGTNDNTQLEYIELQSIVATNVALFDLAHATNTWRLRNAVEFDFPTNQVLAPNQILLVVSFDPVRDLAAANAFRSFYGLSISTRLAGPYQGKLDNSGERLELRKPDPPNTNGTPSVLVEAVHYHDVAPWPTTADGTGASLQRRTAGAYANDSTNWFATGRSPGVANIINDPPLVSLTAPAAGSVFTQPPNIVLSATASDPDDSVARVEFYASGVKLGEDDAAPYDYTWTAPPAGVFQLVASAIDTRNASTLSAPVSITIGQPPSVAITRPSEGFLAIAGVPLDLEATATDGDGTVALVRFLADGQSVAESQTFPFTAEWSNPTPGRHRLLAVATDNAGLSRTSSPINLVVTQGEQRSLTLISTGAVWSYFDLGQDLGSAWTTRDYDQATWKSGPAQLGYGDGDEATEVGFGGQPANRFITTYFRRAFQVTNAAAISKLSVSVLRDDGAVVYLNGQEVFRTGMLEAGDIRYNTLAAITVTGADETSVFYSKDLDPNLLEEGLNLLAVEVHQVRGDSSDISFDLGLRAEQSLYAPFITRHPVGTTTNSGAQVRLEVAAVGSEPLSYRWRHDGSFLTGATAPLLLLDNLQLTDAGDYVVVVSNSVGTATSSPASLIVLSSDSDGDGLPNDWEIRYGLNPTLNDADLDKDGDGLSNLQEFQSGTEPNNPASALRILRIGLESGRRQIVFEAMSDRSYSLLVRSALPGTSWIKLQDIAAKPGVRTITLEDSATEQARFYRLVTPAQ